MRLVRLHLNNLFIEFNRGFGSVTLNTLARGTLGEIVAEIPAHRWGDHLFGDRNEFIDFVCLEEGLHDLPVVVTECIWVVFEKHAVLGDSRFRLAAPL